MGVDLSAATFLRSLTRKGAGLGRMLTLGHQGIYMDKVAYKSFMTSLGRSAERMDYADDLFNALGATSVDIMDVSNYEGAQILHDLNAPIPDEFRSGYDCVFDGGALEHVFNFPVALKNCMEMVKVGGHLVCITVANNYCGHGFYQFTPELFYSSLSEVNGFAVESMLIFHSGRWFSVKKPEDTRGRVQIQTSHPIQLFIAARRVRQANIFENWPQQSDYLQSWSETLQTKTNKSGEIKDRLVENVPSLRVLQSHWKAFKLAREYSFRNSDWFREVDLDA